jgi:hypothetical protein
MPSTFSPNLRIELIGNGEQAGNWGSTTNTNLGTLVEDAISGYVTVSVTSANQAFTYADGASDQARNAVIELTTTTGAAFNVYAPPSPKTYIIYNASAHAATIYNSTVVGNTTAAGMGVVVPAGKRVPVVSNGANFSSTFSATAGEADTQAPGTNNTTIATTAFVQAALRALHPVGSVYINAVNATNPATLLGFGTWAAFGAGRVPVGFNAADPLFDTAEETGGSKDAIVVSHAHTGTTGLQSNDHAHGFSGSTSSAGSHAHSYQRTVGADVFGDGFAVGGFLLPETTTATSVAGEHNHSFSGSTGGVNANHNHAFTTASAGSAGTNANLQPYITVYMWKRTA